MAFTLPTAPVIDDPFTATEIPVIDVQSIPQSLAPPDMTEAFGENPWEVDAREQSARRDEMLSGALAKIDKAALDPESYFKGQDMSLSLNPIVDQRAATVDAFLRLQNGGEPFDTSPNDRANDLTRSTIRQRVAYSLFDGRGADDDDAFFLEIQKSAQHRIDRRALGSTLAEKAHTAAIVSLTDPVKEKEFSWPAFREEARKSPGYTPDDEASLYEAYHASRSESQAALASFAPELKNIWQAMKAGPAGNFSQVAKQIGADLLLGGGVDGKDAIDELNTKDAPRLALDTYYELTEEERPQFMQALATLARSLPKEEQAAFFSNLAKQGGRDIDDLARNIGSIGIPNSSEEDFRQRKSAMESRAGENPVARFLLGGEGGGIDAATYNPEAEEMMRHGQRKLLAARNFASDVRNIERHDYNPVKSAWGDEKTGILETGLYGVPGALASSVMVAIPFVGLPAMYSSMEGAAYDDIRRNLMRGGMSDADATQKASEWASIVAIPQAALEKLQSYALVGKMPFLDKFFTTLGNKVSSNSLRFGIRTGVLGTQETAIEAAQDTIPHIAQELAATLSEEIPDVTWSNGKDGALDGFWTQQATTFVTMLPLALIGAAGGITADKRIQTFQNASDNTLLAIGASREQLAELRAAQAKGIETYKRTLPRVLDNLDPTSETAKQAVADEVAAELAKKGVAAEATQSGILPRFTRTAEGWTLHDSETGEEIGTAPNAEAALRLAITHTDSIDEADANRFAYMATMLEAGDFTALTESLTRKTTTDFRPGETVTATQQAALSPEDAARVADQIRLREKTEGGTGEIADVVYGQSSTTFENRQRRTVNRLNAGASVLTVFHEETHGFWREAVATGRLTQNDALAVLRALDSILAKKSTKEGQPVRFLPADFATLSAKDQATKIDEAISELMEAEVLRTRKGTGIRKIPAGIISRNLAALTRIAGGQATNKFRAFARALRSYFGIAIDRAAHLDRALKDGTINQSLYNEFLTRLLGQEEQAALDQKAKDYEQQIIEGTATPEAIPEGDPFSIGRSNEPLDDTGKTEDIDTNSPGGKSFSLGPAALADAMRQGAIARIRDPQRRVRAMANVARKMEQIHLVKARLELIHGSKRAKASLKKEAAFREASLAEQYENEAYARHYGILDDDDLRKIKSQPVHSFLSDPESPLRGVLMSKSRAIKDHPDLFRLHRAGDYDGSDGVSRSVFGGTRMPDQAAQDLYDANLIKEPTADALWQALLKEQAMVASMKDLHAAAKEDIRNARTRAKQETNEWLAREDRTQDSKFSPKQKVLDALALLDAILSSVSPEIRGKVGGYTQLAQLGSDEHRLTFLTNRLERVDKLLEEELRSEFGKEMKALLKRARPQKDAPGKKPKGTAGSDVHDLFREVEHYMLLPMIEAEGRAADLEARIATGELTPEEESHSRLLADLLLLVGDWTRADAARRESAVTEATRIFAKGYIEHRVIISARSEARQRDRSSLKANTGKSGVRPERIAKAEKQATKLGRTLDSLLSLLSFEQITQLAFGRDSEIGNRLVDWERRASYARQDSIDAKTLAIEELFISLAGSSLAGEKLRYDMGKEKSVTVTNSRGVHNFTQLEAISATLMWMQADGRRHMEGHLDPAGNPIGEWGWTEADMAAIEDQLTDEAKAVRVHLQEQYGSEYDRLNTIYRDLNGINLPRNKFYSPLTVQPQNVQAGQVNDPVTGFAVSAGFSPRSITTRSQTAVAEPLFRDALATYIGHITQIEHYIAYAPFATEAMALINTREVGNAVEASAGMETITILRKWLDKFSQDGNRDAGAYLAFNQQWNRAASRVATAALVGRVSVLAIQSTQLGAALAQMPTGSYLSRFAKLTTGQLQWGDAIKSDYIQRRVRQMPPIVRQAMEGLKSSEPNFIKHAMATLAKTISGADALFTAGTYAIIYDYQKSQGLTGQALIEATERSVERVAQPTRTGTRSFYEVSTSGNPSTRILWAFASDPRQKLALVGFELATGTAGSKARAIAVAWIMGGVVASLIRAVMRDIRDSDDEEIFDERNWSPKRLALMSLTGPLGGLPIAGDLLEAIAFKASGEYLPEGNLFSSVHGILRLANLPDWFTGDRDADEIIGDIDAILTALAPISDTTAAGASAFHIVKDAEGIIRNLFSLAD